MNEFELQEIYEAQLTAQTTNEQLPHHDRTAARLVLNACSRLLSTRLRPEDEHRTSAFSDPHFEDEASVAIFCRPFQSCHHGDGYLLENWTHDVGDQDTVVCLGDITMNRPTDGLIDRLRRRPGRKILVARNHDHAHIRRLRRAFDTVVACAHLPGEPDLLFTHVPLDDVPTDCVNVHGHVHLKMSVDEQRINVCVEQIGYRPIPVADVRRLAERMDQLPPGGGRHDRHLHRLGEGLAGRERRTEKHAVTGTHDTGDRNGPTTAGPDRPTLKPNERLWLEGYLERLKNAPGGLLKRLLVYGSKARGDAGPESDVDVLVLVGDVADAVEDARKLIHGGDDPDGVDHSVVVRTESDWLRNLEKELPFPRNVEAEGVQLHPVHRSARRPPGDRPPVTRKGIGHTVPVWLKEARSDLKTLAFEIKELKDGRLKIPGMAARPAFDAVFFSAMAWCLTRGVSVMRRKDLPTSVERHLIEPEALHRDWLDRIRTLSAAWKAEVDWRPERGPEPTADDAARWAETARMFYGLARDAIAAAGVDIDPQDETGAGGNAAGTGVAP